MNRYALCEAILAAKDRGATRIEVFINGEAFEVPTKFSGEGTTTISTKMNPEENTGAYRITPVYVGASS